ncbi:hypothetical protein HK100_010687 [Physocladia obscura]|uniref:Uncharacterized protein n=1 Tax=Physocladia obscura TaxID=109957 RepID=A0AAD5TB01_9FUNG|nr:hypothetical protein HK100_010687 [Physocladia obscura]
MDQQQYLAKSDTRVSQLNQAEASYCQLVPGYNPNVLFGANTNSTANSTVTGTTAVAAASSGSGSSTANSPILTIPTTITALPNSGSPCALTQAIPTLALLAVFISAVF